MLSFGSVHGNCRYQHWGNTILSGGLRRICWRNREKEHERTIKRRVSWEVRCLNWMQKVINSTGGTLNLQYAVRRLLIKTTTKHIVDDLMKYCVINERCCLHC